MDKKLKAADTRRSLLEAASRIIQNNGVNSLTLAAVAQEAGVSKGGLLYHFPNKESLIEGLVAYITQDFTIRVEQEAARDPDPTRPGAWLRGYIRACFEPQPNANEVSAGLMAAFANDPRLLELIRQGFADWQQQVEQSGIDPTLATIVRLAADGLWLADMFGLAPPSGPLREQVMLKLIELSGGTSA